MIGNSSRPNGIMCASCLSSVLVVVAIATAQPGAPGEPPVHNVTRNTFHVQIQDAITLAMIGDEIEVAAGTYLEQINFLGKAITVRSLSGDWTDTTIDGGGIGPVVRMNGAPIGAVLSGFTIANGTALGGGGVLVDGGSATIERCRIRFNNAKAGGGLAAMSDATPLIVDCLFSDNSAFFGGGLFSGQGSDPVVVACSFDLNSADRGGAVTVSHDASATFTRVQLAMNVSYSDASAVYCDGGTLNMDNCLIRHCFGMDLTGAAVVTWPGSAVTISNCTFVENVGVTAGSIAGAGIDITNCIFRGDTPVAILDDPLTTVGFSNVQGGWSGPGAGNIDADPIFLDPDGPDDDPLSIEDNDYRLGIGSPAIDAGDTPAANEAAATLDLNGDPRFTDDPATPDTGVPESGFDMVDMGAYEFQPRRCPGDTNDGGGVDAVDIMNILLGFGTDGSADGGDVDGSGVVDIDDIVFAVLNFGPCPGQ